MKRTKSQQGLTLRKVVARLVAECHEHAAVRSGLPVPVKDVDDPQPRESEASAIEEPLGELIGGKRRRRGERR